MVLRILRGISRVTAAVTGLMLAYDFICTMEGITIRLPMSPLHELLITTLWMLPWMVLFCSGVEDFGTATQQMPVFWVGVIVGLAFLYHFQRYASSSVLTKVAMPLLATAGGLLPHIIRRVNIIFTISSLVAGIAGLVILYLALTTLLTSSFATKGLGIVVITFAMASLVTGVLSVASLRRYHTEIA